MTNAPSADRPPPPDVPVVLHKGVRYAQDLAGNEPASSAAGGGLTASNPTTGALLWRMRVYTLPDHAGAGVEAPGRYFRSMKVVEGTDTLQIEDEVGVTYQVNLVRRSATRVGGPPETATAAPPKPKPKPVP